MKKKGETMYNILTEMYLRKITNKISKEKMF